MKKLISLFLVISMVLPVMLVAPMSAFAKDINFLVAESYNEQPTGAVPGNGAVAAGNAMVVVTKDKSDKDVELSGKAQDSNLYYAVPQMDKPTLSMYVDLEYDNVWSYTEFYINNSANKAFVLAYINEKGEIYSGDARLSTGVPRDRATSIQVTYNSREQRLTLYMGDKCLVAHRYMGSSSYEEIAGFGIKVKGKSDASCLVDNFAVIEGADIVKSKDVPKKGFSSEGTMSEEVVVGSDGESQEESGIFVGDTVFVNRTFEEEGIPEFDAITLFKYGNEIIVDKSVFDGNKYTKIIKKSADESFIQYAGNGAAKRIVIQSDFSTDSTVPPGKLVYVRDGNAASMFCQMVNVAGNGNMTTTNGIVVGKIEARKWTNLACAINVDALTFDVYVNGELKAKDVPFQNKTITGIPVLRITCNKGNAIGDLLIDNIRTYEGTGPREIKDTGRKSKVTPDSVAQTYLGTMTAVHPFVSTYYVNKEKHNAKYEMIQEDDDKVVYVHEEDLKAIFGTNVKLTSPHSTKASYYDLAKTGVASGYFHTTYDTRLFLFDKFPIDVVNNTSGESPEDKFAEIQRYMFSVRPSANELLDLFKENGPKGSGHPRVLINADDLERIKTLYKTDPLMQEWGASVIAHANTLFGKAPYTYPLNGGSSMAEVDLSGNDILCLGLAYHLTGNERYAARTWAFLENICNLSVWNPYGYLDVGELGYITAVGYDWFYDYWTPEQRKILEENIYEKCVYTTYQLYYNELEGKTFVNHEGRVDEYYTGWWDGTNNWNAVCNGGVMCAAMAILDKYPEKASAVIEFTNRGLEYMMPSFYPVGAWEEGGGYWSYALSYLIYTISTLRNTFGTDFNLTKAPGLDMTGWFGTYLAGATGQFAIGDVGSDFANNPQVMWLAKEFNDADLMTMRMNEFKNYGFKGGAREMIYYDPDIYNPNAEAPLDTHMAGMEVIALREAWYDPGTTFVGISGGSNSRGHGHMDIGAFQIDMAGERFIRDTGAENYNAVGGYFTKNRYQFYRARPEGHNLYIINPEVDNTAYYGQVLGSEVKGEILVSKPRGAIAQMDLTPAYSNWATRAMRGMMLSDDRRSITIRDEIDLIEPNSQVYWFAHTRANIEVDGNRAIFTLNGKKMEMIVETNGTDWTLEETEAKTLSNVTKDIVKDTNNTSNGLRKITFKVTGNGRLNITVKFKQYDDLMVSSDPVDGDISTWTIPDGEVTPLPVVDSIYIDGQLVEGFDPKITGYSYLLPEKAESAPTITVDTDLKYEIIPTPTPEGDTLVKVYSPGRDDVYRTYRINFWKKPPLADVDGLRRYPVYKVTAKRVPQEANPAENVIDQDFGTRWAADGYTGEWIMLELDDVYPVDKMGVSWMNGDARTTTYKLEYSVDGVNWVTVFDGVSSGTTIYPEYFDLNGAMVKYARCTGYGNSVSEWNSVTEFMVLGSKR